MSKVKAISLWQPWASAIAYGAKLVETRSWKTTHRGLLLIHAARSKDGRDWDGAIRPYLSGVPEYSELPFGAIVAVAELVTCLPTTSLRSDLSDRELALGDYSAGRYGWILRKVRRIEPIPYKGKQGLFEVPHDVVKAILS